MWLFETGQSVRKKGFSYPHQGQCPWTPPGATESPPPSLSGFLTFLHFHPLLVVVVVVVMMENIAVKTFIACFLYCSAEESGHGED